MEVWTFGRTVVLASRDKDDQPELFFGKRATLDIPFLVGGPRLTVTIGKWNVRPQVSRSGLAIGRLWIYWSN